MARTRDDITAAEAKVAAAEATVSLSWIEAPFQWNSNKIITKSQAMKLQLVKAAFRIDDLSELFVDVESF